VSKDPKRITPASPVPLSFRKPLRSIASAWGLDLEDPSACLEHIHPSFRVKQSLPAVRYLLIIVSQIRTASLGLATIS